MHAFWCAAMYSAASPTPDLSRGGARTQIGTGTKTPHSLRRDRPSPRAIEAKSLEQKNVGRGEHALPLRHSSGSPAKSVASNRDRTWGGPK